MKNTRLKAAGIIAEYNPFHNGHAFHIEETKKKTQADCIIAVMSGDFVQRGEPAILDKFTRAKMALFGGVDLVVELPCIAATGSAGYFAKGGIAILNTLKVDYLSFGMESTLSALEHLAQFYLEHEDSLEEDIKKLQKKGFSYPKAREEVLKDTFSDSDSLHLLLSSPNNILALEYLKECLRSNSTMKPIGISRTGSSYHEEELKEGSSICSATAARAAITSGNLDLLSTYLPGPVYAELKKSLTIAKPVTLEDYKVLLKASYLQLAYEMDLHQDISISDLDRRILKILQEKPDITIQDLCEEAHTKSDTLTSIRRHLLHKLLTITQKDYDDWEEHPCSYLRILGINDRGAAYLGQLSEPNIPIITKASSYQSLLARDHYGDELYRLAFQEKNSLLLPSEYHRKFLKQ
ncbi:MAG: nucleotidyltransferase family protein [Lachnospiraceae bacterium]|nr:nucleotidyltransferase family protein [Lachnospiraceae bacterium]